MQDNYQSLDPEFVTQKQVLLDREHVYSVRYQESAGGPFAQSVGFVTGLTAASFMYTRAQ